MEQSGAESPRPERERGADAALRRLEERLERASNAAERLFAEAASEAASAAVRMSGRRTPRAEADGPPASAPGQGWQLPREDAERELDNLIVAWHSVRDLIPPDLRRRLADAVRELLVAVRALIDWYLERHERRHEPVEVQDIPIV